jgi:hypothetical protein
LIKVLSHLFIAPRIVWSWTRLPNLFLV